VTTQPIELIPISEINVPNPRTRNKVVFDLIVANISEVGLKKPITVCPRPASDCAQDKKYDLVCGQGRLEACLALGETAIPAVVIEATKEQRYLMSLVENIARRPPSNRDLLREIRAMTGRGLKAPTIAAKLGLDRTYIYGIVTLLERGEESLITSVESRRLPISVATVIASGVNEDVRRALKEAYERGELRGQRLVNARRIIADRLKRRAAKQPRMDKKMSTKQLVNEYRREIDKTKALVRKASITSQRLLLLVSMMRRLYADENFIVLLKAESLLTLPAWLAGKVGEGECS
jgi:ParB family transcriptional regulator, chromosome partitioning protein